MKTVISFNIQIEYESDGRICAESMAENLSNALEKDRQEGILTVSEIKANWIKVSHKELT